MNKFKFLCFCTCLIISSGTNLIAQQQPGQLVLNIGVGFSPEFNGDMGNGPGWLNYPVGTSMDGWGDYGYFKCSPTIPNIGGTIDFGLPKRFSIGLASSYQNELVSWGYGLDHVYNGYPIYSDKVTRVNMAFRLLYHLINNTHIDLYTGIRFGSSYWHDSPSPDNTNIYSVFAYTPSTFLSNSNNFVPSFQYVWGLRYFPIKNLGIHVELGIGSPYLVEGGLSFRINTRKNIPGSNPCITTPQENYGGHQIK
jgi:hypothetical protein